MPTIHLTPQQELLTRALVECGYYGTQSEVGRAAFDKFLQDLPPARKREIGLHLYKRGEATVSRFAEIADLPLHEARVILESEGVLRVGQDDDPPASARRAAAKKAAAKYR